MIDELDLVTGNQLKDCTISFHQKKRNRFAISEMFSCELKFDSDCLKRQLRESINEDFQSWILLVK